MHAATHQNVTKFVEFNQAFNRKWVSFRYRPTTENELDLRNLIRILKNDLQELLILQLAKKTSVKAGLIFHVLFTNPNSNDVIEHCIRGKGFLLTHPSQILNAITKATESAFSHLLNHTESGSGLIVTNIEAIDVTVGQAPPLTGTCDYLSVDSPKSCVNFPRTNSNPKHFSCFFRAIAFYFLNTEDETRLNNFISTYIQIDPTKPLELHNIKKFEKTHSHLNVNINVLGTDGKDVYPLLRSEGSNFFNIFLILYYWTSGTNLTGHYAVITNLDQFCKHTYTYNLKSLSHKSSYTAFRCPNCLASFKNQLNYSEHAEYCFKNELQCQKLPLDSIIKFKHINNQNLSPLALFFDFEAINASPTKVCNCAQKAHCVCKTKNIFTQKPICWHLIAITRENKVILSKAYSGENANIKLLDTLLTIEKTFLEYISLNNTMIFSDKDKVEFLEATICHICQRDLGCDKVRDHDHITGKYLGAAHNECNLNRRETKYIPIFAHNFSKYDSHFLLQALSDDSRITVLRALPNNSQHLKTLRINSYVFLDTLDFLQGSLDTLVQELPTNFIFNILKQSRIYSLIPEDKTFELFKKGEYCYEWATSLAKLKETTELPPLKAFFSKLTNKNISLDQYNHAQRMFNLFQCKSMLDYTLAYCELDVFLLAEVFFAFRAEIFSAFSLDCCRYMSLPQLTFDAMLKKTGVILKNVKTIDQYLFIESGIRGGVSFINQRYAKEDFSNDPSYQIVYIDANNLYGGSQSKYLPTGDYDWVPPSLFSQIDFLNWPEHSSHGFILEVDLDYPSSLHLTHSSFPLAPERMTINESDLSPYAKKTHNLIFNKSKVPSSSRLATTLHPKKRYIIHYITLQSYVSLGLKLVKIHKVLKFAQSAFLAPYIDFCTLQRQLAKSDFKKRLWKLFINSCFGKFIESVRRYRRCKIALTENQLIKYMASPLADSFTIVSPNCVIITSVPPVVFLNKPIAIGFTILDRSKDFMYRQFYTKIYPSIGQNAQVLFSDTDSLCIGFHSNNKYPLSAIKEIMDFSNYPPNHPLYDNSNKNKLFYFKDECGGDRLTEFVGLRAKCYGYKTHTGSFISKLKGVTKSYRKTVNFDNYLECIKFVRSFRVTQFHLASVDHQISMTQVSRLAFSSYDNNRYIFECGIHSVPYGSVYIGGDCIFCTNTGLLAIGDENSELVAE